MWIPYLGRMVAYLSLLMAYKDRENAFILRIDLLGQLVNSICSFS